MLIDWGRVKKREDVGNWRDWLEELVRLPQWKPRAASKLDAASSFSSMGMFDKS